MSHTSASFHIVLVGLGRVARKHLKAFKQWPERFQLTAVVERVPSIAEERLEAAGYTAEERAGIRVYTSLEETLAQLPPQPGPVIVALTTPSGTHYSLAKQVLQAGHHVLIEKPMTLDLGEGRELLELAEAQAVKIAVGHIYRFFPIVDLIQEEIAAGDWGEILQAEVTVHWGHDQAYYDQADWRGTWASDGGVLMNQTVHALDLMAWLLGQEIRTVNGRIARLAHDMEAEDYGTAILELANGAYLRVEGTTNTPPEAQAAEFSILTERGSIVAGLRAGRPYFSLRDPAGRKLRRGYLRRFLRQAHARGGLIRGLKSYFNPHTGIYLDLADAIETNRSPRADGHSGYTAVEHILAIYRSAVQDGAPVALPLERGSLQAMEAWKG